MTTESCQVRGSKNGHPIRPEWTVEDVVRAYPETMPVFAKHRIDLCCGGKKSLAEVCERHHIPLAGLLAELEAASAGST
jgi:iron-sulfur cluster repair protein YtfE (RIC family)